MHDTESCPNQKKPEVNNKVGEHGRNLTTRNTQVPAMVRSKHNLFSG
jgi:hypothetical protein